MNTIPKQGLRSRLSPFELALFAVALVLATGVSVPAADVLPRVAAPPESPGMKSLFNGKDLTGWDGDPRLHPRSAQSMRAPKNQFSITYHYRQQLLAVDIDGWKREVDDIGENCKEFGAKLPAALAQQLDNLRARLSLTASISIQIYLWQGRLGNRPFFYYAKLNLH